MGDVGQTRSHRGMTSRRAARTALASLAAVAVSQAADRSWNTGNGTWVTPGAWSPAGVPGVNDTVRIGNLPGVQDTTVNAAGANFVPDAIEISDGMTLDTGGTEFVGFDLLVTISGGDSRFIVRPHAGVNEYDFIGEVHINPGATMELTNNVPIQLFWDSHSWGRIEGWGEVRVNSFTPFNNNGVINPASGGLRFEQGWPGNHPDFDLDGSAEFGQVWLDVPYSTLEITAGALTDPFDGVINMAPGALLTMHIEDDWQIASGGVLNAVGGDAIGASQINGDDLTFGGSMTIGDDGSLRILSDATVEATATHWLLPGSRLEYDGATTVNDGFFFAFSESTFDFDGQLTVRGGEFQTPSTDPADGVVNFNGSTIWNGSGPVEITGVARQMGSGFVNGPMVINADVFDMDGDGDTPWTVWNDLTINADGLQPDGSDTFDGVIDVAAAAGRLTVNIEPEHADFEMNGEMNLIGHPAVYHTRYAGDTLQLHGELNASGKVAVDAYVWAYEGAINIANADATLRLHGGCIIGVDCAISGAGEIRVAAGAPLKALFPNTDFGGVGLVNDGMMGVPGQTSVDRFEQTANGVWGIYLRGYEPEDNDHLQVTHGDATLDGKLEVDFFLFEPVVGDEFTILNVAGDLGGMFDENPSNIHEGRRYDWSVLYGRQSVRLRLQSITDCPLGDLDNDGDIDVDDLAVLLSRFGTVGGATWGMGDVDDDDDVDLQDLAYLIANYGKACD